MQKKAGDNCEIGGDYLCLYHLKNKLRIKIGSTFPRCDFAGIKCEGYWHLKKEIKEKTQEEKWEAQNRKRYKPKKRRRGWDEFTKPSIEEKYKFDDWKDWNHRS